MQIGFIGLGVMGGHMASHLAAAGHRLGLFDRRPNTAARIAARYPNAFACASPRAAAHQADFVITMLPSGAVVREVVFGADGLAASLTPGALLLDCSSSEPWLTKATATELARAGIDMVDAPVSGAEAGAREANLVFMCGGPPAAIDRVRPILSLLGRQIHYLGPIGAGHTMKCINNLITAITFVATGEGLILGKRLGLDPAVMTDVLNASTGASWISNTHIKQRILNRRFDDPFKLALMAKDVGIAARLAAEHDLPLALAPQARTLWDEAARVAGSEASVSEMIRWLESINGVVLSPGSSRGDS